MIREHDSVACAAQHTSQFVSEDAVDVQYPCGLAGRIGNLKMNITWGKYPTDWESLHNLLLSKQ